MPGSVSYPFTFAFFMPDPTENPKLRRIAAALGYDPSKTDAPKLVAKGQGDIADRIIALAKEHNIPIREDRDLVTVLAKLDLDQEIPSELYRTIAELLAFVYRANNLYKDGK
ncbi:MAG: flagellar biosynthesis protein [Candidatus Latescibacterota bacterium]|jgi:flagellar biosynthesis protein